MTSNEDEVGRPRQLERDEEREREEGRGEEGRREERR